MVHFPEFARTRLWIHRAVLRFYLSGFPHSEISGSMPACGSPKLIAACHVFHRLLLPRHPPCALSSLTTKFTRHTGRFPPFARSANSQTVASFLSFHPERTAKPSNTPRKLHGPKNSAHRALNAYLRFRAPADISFSLGTHKNLQPCRLPNLFSCQISSSLACANSPA